MIGKKPPQADSKSEKRTGKFYDNFWPRNVPDFRKSEEHIFGILPQKEIHLALDAGCGSGVCSLALSKRSDRVISCDLSMESLKTAVSLKERAGIDNIEFVNLSLTDVPFKNRSFDLILSWGVIHHTVDPLRVFSGLSGILKSNGCLIAAVYLRTGLTFAHELLRKLCLRIRSPIIKMIFIETASFFVKVLDFFHVSPRSRNDNITPQSLVEDWFFVPVKHFFSVKELEDIFRRNGLTFEVLCPQTGRLKSSSNVIVRGFKN